MPWPPRLLSPPLLPLLTFIVLLSTALPSSASTLSYADGQPEYPSQPELTSDRDTLARIFLQGLLEKEGKSNLPHSFSNGGESVELMDDGQLLKRLDGGNPNGQQRYVSLPDIYPRGLHEKAYGDIVGSDEVLDGQDEEFGVLEPHIDRERIISELLARGHPYTGHRVHGFADPSQLSEDPDEQNIRLKELLRLVIGDEENPTEFLSAYDKHHKTRPRSKDGDGDWSSPFKNKRSTGTWGRSILSKRDPFGINARGFHEDVFNRDFGSFNPMKRVARSTNDYQEEEEGARRKKERTESQRGNKTQINASSIGGTNPTKTTEKDKDEVPRRVKRATEDEVKNTKPLKLDVTLADKSKDVAAQVPLTREERAAEDRKMTTGGGVRSTQLSKRRPEMDSSGFHGDTFNSGFGDFWTMKRNSHHEHPSRILVVGPFTKRRPEMDSSGFHGDTFNSGFGDFWTMKRAVHGANPPGYDPERVISAGKRRPEMDSSGFHGDTFSSGFGDFYTMKRSPPGMSQLATLNEEKRRPEMDSSGFHGDTFSRGFGDFWTMKRNQGSSSPSHYRYVKRRPEMDSSGFHGDTFNSGFGDFWTMKRNALQHYLGLHVKRRPEMDSSGFHGDTFNSGFGDFWTMKRDGTPGAVNSLHGSRMQAYGPSMLTGRTGGEWYVNRDEDGDADDSGISLTAGKRRPEMDSSGFHGDTFNSGFGDFWTMKRSPSVAFPRMRREVGREEKRRPEMDASGFHGDTFSNGFGDFWTLKRADGGAISPSRWPIGKLEMKRRPEMDSSGFHGDTFNGGFGDFWTMKRSNGIPYLSHFRNVKRRPEMDSSGFHGDTFNGGFGDFWTMKRGDGFATTLPGRGSLLHPTKRKPEMDSSGFHGDTFNGGFGDFWTMKRGSGNMGGEVRVKQDIGQGAEEVRGSPVFHGDVPSGGFGEASQMKAGGGDDAGRIVGKEKDAGEEPSDGIGKSETKSENTKN